MIINNNTNPWLTLPWWLVKNVYNIFFWEFFVSSLLIEKGTVQSRSKVIDQKVLGFLFLFHFITVHRLTPEDYNSFYRIVVRSWGQTCLWTHNNVCTVKIVFIIFSYIVNFLHHIPFYHAWCIWNNLKYIFFPYLMLPFIPLPLHHLWLPFILFHFLFFKNLNTANISSVSLDSVSREDGWMKRTLRYTVEKSRFWFWIC